MMAPSSAALIANNLSVLLLFRSSIFDTFTNVRYCNVLEEIAYQIGSALYFILQSGQLFYVVVEMSYYMIK